MEWSLGQMVRSKQGRDNGTYYVIVKIDENVCYCVDGRKTTLLKPKRKNIKHLQATHRISEKISEQLNHGEMLTELEIRDFLNQYRSDR